MTASCECGYISTITPTDKCRCCMWEVSYIESIILSFLCMLKNIESDDGGKVWPSVVSFFGIPFPPTRIPFVN
jgi:hypothetical protein